MSLKYRFRKSQNCVLNGYLEDGIKCAKDLTSIEVKVYSLQNMYEILSSVLNLANQKNIKYMKIDNWRSKT